MKIKTKKPKTKSVCGEAKDDHKKLKKENQSYNKLLTSTSNIILAGFGGFGGSSSFVLTRYLAAVTEKQNKSAKIAFMTFLLCLMKTVRVTNVLISNYIIKKSQHILFTSCCCLFTCVTLMNVVVLYIFLE